MTRGARGVWLWVEQKKEVIELRLAPDFWWEVAFADRDGGDDDDDEGDDSADDDDGKLSVQHRREEKKNGTRTNRTKQKQNKHNYVVVRFLHHHDLEHLETYMSQKQKTKARTIGKHIIMIFCYFLCFQSLHT